MHLHVYTRAHVVYAVISVLIMCGLLFILLCLTFDCREILVQLANLVLEVNPETLVLRESMVHRD